MEKFGRSQPVKRVEDIRFVTGHGGYVDDIAPEGSLVAVFYRSPVAHAQITGLGLEEARALEGVHAVLSAGDLAAEGITEGLGYTREDNRDGSLGAAPRYFMLAEERVRFVGEPLAVVLAESVELAKDALELIEFDYEELPAETEMGAGAAELHPEAPGNKAVDFCLGDPEAMEKVIAEAAHVVRADIMDNRVMVVAMEPRGCFAEWDGTRMHLSYNGQGVWAAKAELAKLLSLEPENVRVTHPDVGGGFGMKAKLYPEYIVCAAAARKLGRPVRWIADRTESMLADNGARDLSHESLLAFDKDLKIIGYHVKTKYNLGAYPSNFGQKIQTTLFAKVFTGVYDIKTALLEAEGYFTNTTPTDAYRGAGRPEAIFALERMMHYAAHELGVDVWELRRRNFVQPGAFPYRSFSGELYDVGNFPALLDRAAEEVALSGFEARVAASREAGKLRGMGLCYYIESILGDPNETAQVEFLKDGSVNIYVGTQSNGQGHETVYAHFLSDQTGIPQDQIRVIQGDSDLIATGGGTGGSRSVTTQANATLAVVEVMVEAFGDFLAEKMAVPREDVSFDDESFRIKGSNAAPTMLDVAEMAAEAGRQDLMIHRKSARLPGRSYPNGVHVAEVEVDPETGAVSLERYVVVDDFGNLINPMLAEGQVHGGVVQGLGQVLMENVTYDEDGQLLTASFMDYAVPRAADVPMIEFTSVPVPSTANPMGMKGCGEAGTVGSMAAGANAVMDALARGGVKRAEMPFTPSRVWKMLRDADTAA